MLLVTALVVALGLTGAALSKNKPGKPPHHPKGPAHHTYAWHDVPIAGSNVRRPAQIRSVGTSTDRDAPER